MKLALLFLLISLPVLAQQSHDNQVDRDEEVESQSIAASSDTNERWSIKTLSDIDTSQIDFSRTTRTTVTELTRLPFFSTGNRTARQPAEEVLYEVVATAYEYKKEDDGDIHLLLRDPNTDSTMVTELPNPADPEVAGTSRAFLISAARKWLADSIGNATTKFKPIIPPRLVRIVGVAFYDFNHGQKGKAANNIELHPVLMLGDAVTSGIRQGEEVPGEIDLSCTDSCMDR